MGKNSFVMYTEWDDIYAELDDESLGILSRAIMNYQTGKELPEMNGMVRMAFVCIKGQLDRDTQKYDEKCEENRKNGKKGGRPKKANGFSENPEKANGFSENRKKPNMSNEDDYEDVDDNDDENENENEDDTANAVKEKGAKAPKKKKHRYGEYQHVLLTDDERDRLMDEFGDIRANKAITYLDEYIQMKGYKAKDHYLAIRKWVFDALDREERQKARSGTTQRSQFEDLMEQIRRDEYDG